MPKDLIDLAPTATPKGHLLTAHAAMKIMERLPAKKSPGPTGLPPVLYKELRQELGILMADLVSRIMI